MKTKTKLTSVRLLEYLYKQFKQTAISDDFTLQKLVNRSIKKYVDDKSYRIEINKYAKLQSSGSRF